MKKLLLILCVIGFKAVLSLQAQPFLPGHLVILRQGDGVQLLGNSGNTVYLDQYTTNGALVDSIKIPDSGANPCIQSGSASSEGQLTLSPDGKWLGFGGYKAARPYSSSLSGASAANVPRVGGYVNYMGQFVLKATPTSIFSGNNIRAGVTDGNNFWVGGASSSSGNGSFWLGSSAVGLSTTLYNVRAMNIYNGSLYLSTQTGTNSRGIWAFNGTPTGASVLAQVVATGDKSNPNDFVMNAAGTILYVADDGSSSGVQRWNKVGSAWALQYTFTTGNGARSLAVDFSGTHPAIYAIPAGGTNRIMKFVDAGAASAGTVIVTAPGETAFRGIRFAPSLAVNAALPAPGALGPIGAVSDARPVLHWAEVSGATSYIVGLKLPSGRTWWNEVSGATNCAVPFDLRNADYTLTVAANDAAGRGAVATNHFTVQLSTLSFALICDNQSDKISDTYPVYASNSISPELLVLSKKLAAEPIDFVLFGGDLIASKDLDLTNISALPTRFSAWKSAMEPVLDTGIPVYPTRGNHDAVYYGGPPDSAALASQAAAIWKAQFPSLTNLSGPSTELGFSYTFARNGVRVVVLDDYVKPGTVNSNWLATVLATNTAKRVFVLKHQPIWTDADKRNPASSSDVDTLAGIMDKGGVTAVLCGHVHQYDRLTPSSHVFQQIINGKAGSPPTEITYTPPASWAEIQNGQTNFGYCLFTIQGTNVNMVWKYFNRLADTTPIIGDAYTNNLALDQPDSLSPSATVISQAQPTLTWSAVPGAAGYTLTITYPNRTTTSWYIFGSTQWTSLTRLTNGVYSYTVTATDNAWSSPAASGKFVIQTTVPSLKVAQSGTNVLVSWPADTAPASLIYADEPEFIAWGAASQQPLVSNGQKIVTIPASNKTQYYRLRISAE